MDPFTWAWIAHLESERSLRLARTFNELDSVRNRMYYDRQSLQNPPASPWSEIFHRGTNRSFIHFTGINRDGFLELRDAFVLLWEPIRRMNGQRGRPRILDTSSTIGLTLAYMRSPGRIQDLCLLFGVTQPTITEYLWDSIQCLIDVLQNHPDARIQLPNRAQWMQHAQVLEDKEPVLTGEYAVAAFLDGCNLRIPAPDNQELQRLMYCGWLHMTCVSNLLMFTPDGRLVWALVNAPGSYHDSRLAVGAVRAYYMTGFNQNSPRIVVDSAFPRKNVGQESPFIGALKENELTHFNNEHNAAERNQMHAICRAATSIRQASEWSNNTWKVWKRLTGTLPSDTFKRQNVLHLSCLLHNYRLTHGGQCQVRTVYEDYFANIAQN